MTRQMILDAALRDIKIAKFLATKVPADKRDWRPTPGQRSVTELLQYLSRCGIGASVALLAGNWDAAQPYREEAAKVTLENFGEAMDRQAVQLTEFVNGISESDWTGKQITLPWEVTVPVPQMLLEVTVKFLCAYRMQLFLYLKQMGVEGLGTSHAWAGCDPKPQG